MQIACDVVDNHFAFRRTPNDSWGNEPWNELALNSKIVHDDFTLTNHAITKQSSAGEYYSDIHYDITKTGYIPISVTVTTWSLLLDTVVPYISDNTVGLMSKTSQSPSVGIRVVYIKV